MEQNRKRSFWDFSCNDILGILCAAAVPIALGIYTAITYQQEHENARKIQELKVKQAIELRQATIFDLFLDNIFKLEKNGYLNESHGPLWAFANAYYRAAHRQLDHGRKADVLQFLKEKELIGNRNCTTPCGPKIKQDIIRLNELDFDKVYFRSDTGTLNQLNLRCVSFDDVSMSGAMFPFANLNDVSFDRGRLNNVNFGSSSLICASFNGTYLEEVDFANANLTNAIFWNVDLSSAILTDEQIRQAYFWNVIMPYGRNNFNRTPPPPSPLPTTTTGSSTTSPTSITSVETIPSTMVRKITTEDRPNATTSVTETTVIKPTATTTTTTKEKTTPMMTRTESSTTNSTSITSVESIPSTMVTKITTEDRPNATTSVIETTVIKPTATTTTATKEKTTPMMTRTESSTTDSTSITSVESIPSTMVTRITTEDRPNGTTAAPETTVIKPTATTTTVTKEKTTPMMTTTESSTTNSTSITSVESIPSTMVTKITTEDRPNGTTAAPETTVIKSTTTTTTTLILPTTTVWMGSTTVNPTITTKEASDCELDLITFDDIPGASNTSHVVPTGYKNLNWTNAEYINVLTTPINSIFRQAVISSPFVIHNSKGGAIRLNAVNNRFFSIRYVQATTALTAAHNITLTISIRNMLSFFRATQPKPSRYRWLCDTECDKIDSLVIETEYDRSVLNVSNTTEVIIDDLCISAF